SENRLLLFQFVFENGALAGNKYWATPGGGIENGETYKEVAQRELLEETGICADVGKEVGQRTAVFQIPSGEYVNADERYFFVRTQYDSINEEGQTPLERKYMKQYYWWSLDELHRTSETIYPEQLFELLEKVKSL
ncbi:MAG: NUDIX domain-containing protein, partial [Rhizobiaceae bacterium]|nr:NUDIX domain-containing protein [Rhizobiaceae bacterium]